MYKIDLEQGSQEWLDWRKSVLTATDAPMLMGASPYVTPYKGWQRKCGLAEEQKSNPAMQRGQRDEPIARKMFIERTGIHMDPCVIQSETNKFLGASLDGLSSCGKYILEVKSNGDQYHYFLDKNGIPEFHMMQMQHQMLCTDDQVRVAFYASYNKGNLIIKEVYADPAWMKDYLEEAIEFWKRVLLMDPPPLSCKDYRDMEGNNLWEAHSNHYREICEQIRILEERKEQYKEALVSLCNGDSSRGNGLKVLNKTTRGRIDYDSIPELKNLNLEKYRKEPTTTWVVTIDRKAQ